MRTTLNIDDDVLDEARSMAKSTSQPSGRVMSDLLRRGLRSFSRIDYPDDGCEIPVFDVPPGSRPITLEDVKGAQDEDDEEMFLRSGVFACRD